MLLAVEAKVVLAMLAPTRVLLPFDDGYAPAGGNRTKAHVIHGCNRILDAELLVLLHHVPVQAQILDVQIVQVLEAIGVWAAQLTHLSCIDLRRDHFVEALSAIVVLAAGQELKFVAEEFAGADATLLLLTVELPPEGLISHLETLLELPRILEFNRNVATLTLHELGRVLLDQGRNQISLDRHDHLVDGWAVLLPHFSHFLKNCRFELLIKGAFQGN